MTEHGGSRNIMKRVAIFGAGKMALHHVKAINLQKDAKVVAIADLVVEEKPLKNILPQDIAIFQHPKELLHKIHPDVVHICTPPDTHSALAALALNEGSHIYVEKPFSLSSQEALEVISMAKRLQLKVCAGHQLLFEHHMFNIQEKIKKLGKIVLVESYFSFKAVRQSSDGRAAISPLEQLIDILPHPIYLLLYFLKFKLKNLEEIPVEISALDIRTDGNVSGIFRCGNTTGILNVTLTGRPIESFIKVVGTNGSLCAEYVRGTVVTLPGPGTSGISKVLNPYSQARQDVIATSIALFNRILKKQTSYPGLYEIIRKFYNSLDSGKETVLGELSIMETVTTCEEIGKKLKSMEMDENSIAETKLSQIELNMPQPDTGRGGVVVTGGTGMLGVAVARELRKYNWDVRVTSRKQLPFSLRIPGVKYFTADLADLGVNVPERLFQDVSTVVHCAAETIGGKEAHQRNTINATRNLLETMAKYGVKKFIHISSIAVLKTNRDNGGSIDENTDLDAKSEERGPYVWGKAEAEKLAGELSNRFGINYRIIRPGPLVDYNAFIAPGRLGREAGRMYIYIGSKNDRLSLCNVQTAAEVIHLYVASFDSMPPVLNLVEPDSPTRGELVSIVLKSRPDLKSFRIPSVLFWLISTALKGLQRVLHPKRKPLDIYAAFASEKYNAKLASSIIEKSKNNINKLKHDVLVNN